MFCIGKFPNEKDAVAVFPACWKLGEDKCYWPPRNKGVKYAKNMKMPGEDWTLCEVKILKCFDSYDDARSNLDLATVTSDLDETPRVKKARLSLAPSTPPSAPGTFGIPSGLNFDVIDRNDQIVPGTAATITAADFESVTGTVVHYETVDSRPQTEFEGIVLEVNRQLASFKSKQDEQGEMLNQILSSINSMANKEPHPFQPDRNIQPLQQIVELPMTSVEDLETLNEFLTTEKGILSLKRYLIGTGGSTVEDSVQRTMEKLLPDELMVLFSLKGKRGKRSFYADFKSIYDGIIECIREYPSLSLIAKAGNADDKTFEQAMASAFKKAYDRVSRRQLKAAATIGSPP